MKKLSIVVAGTGQIRDAEIQPGTTAGDILQQLTLPDYLLSKGPNEPFFAATESVYDKVRGRREGVRVHQSRSRSAHGVRIKDLGTRPAPAMLLRLFGGAERGHAPTVAVQRRQIPYWQERGWTRNGNRYEGSYQTPFGAFSGTVEQERSGHIHFFLYNPSPEIQRHSHWTCFQSRGDGWYSVHMARQPRDVSSGIMTIERLITEAYRQ